MSKSKVAIVGSGGGGLAAAALLSTNGYEVVMFERDAVVGGKAKSSEFNGFWIDEEFHVMIKVANNKSHREKVGEVIGFTPDAVGMKANTYPVFLPDGTTMCLPEFLPTTAEYKRENFKKVYGNLFSDEDCEAIEQFMEQTVQEILKKRAEVAGKSVDDFKKKFPYVPIRDYAMEHAPNPKVRLFFEKLGSITYNLQHISRGTLSTFISFNHVLAMSEGKTRMFTNIYPTHPEYGGLAAVWYPYADIIRENGGEIRTETPVKKILFSNGKATGVELYDGEQVMADYVICNIGPHQAVSEQVLDMNVFTGDYKQELQGKIDDVLNMASKFPVKAVNTVLCLNKKITDDDFGTFIDDEGEVIACFQINTDWAPKSAPPGKQKIQLHVYIDAPDKKWSYDIAEKWTTEKIMPALRKRYPGIDAHIEFQINYLSPEGTFGPMMNQMFGKPVFFKEVTPIENFFFVGMFCGNVGLEGVLVSGGRVAEAIIGKKLIED